MQASGGPRKAVTRNGVAAGSVWETRMRMDEVKGGIKVFNGDESREGEHGSNADEDGLMAAAAAAESRKKRSWRQPETVAEGPADKNPISLRMARSELANLQTIGSGEHCGELGREKIAVARLENAGEAGEKRVLLIGNGDEVGVGDGQKEAEEEMEIEIELEGEMFDDKEMDSAVEKQKNAEEEKGIQEIQGILVPPKVEKKTTPVMDHHAIEADPIRITEPPCPPEEEVEEMFEDTSVKNRTQNIVDLVMWRDPSKSAFIFGFGTFLLLSSSYAKDLNFSLISAISYLGLVYLALIFLRKSVLRRGEDLEYDERVERYMVGEQEAIWVLRLLLPYINELLSKLRILFCGDPATTMKVAPLLFAMARFGSSISIWTLAKLVFFGAFTVPKVYSSYSTQLAPYGKFWLERIRDAWESSTHKKAIAAGIFTVIWNVPSTVVRIWAVFMLVVAVKFYQQQCVAQKDCVGQDAVVAEQGREDSKPEQGQGIERKVKKGI